MPRYDYLMKPLTVAGLTLKNRLLSAPTSMAELGPEEHYTDENFDYYRLRAAGGAALVTVGDVIVDNATGRSHPQQLGMDDPSVISWNPGGMEPGRNRSRGCCKRIAWRI